MNPLLTVIVPTIGRPSLVATLESLAQQRLAQYLEVLVVADTHNRAVDQPSVESMPGCFASLQWLEHDAGHSAWGHPQRNWAMERAQGLWVATLDDDDVWVPGAMDSIFGCLGNSDKTFHIFKMMHAQSGVVIWNRRYPSQGNVGTPMMVWKNDSPVGEWGSLYEGDFSFVSSTVHKLPNGMDDLYWQDKVIASIRPVGPPAGMQTW